MISPESLNKYKEDVENACIVYSIKSGNVSGFEPYSSGTGMKVLGCEDLDDASVPVFCDVLEAAFKVNENVVFADRGTSDIGRELIRRGNKGRIINVEDKGYVYAYRSDIFINSTNRFFFFLANLGKLSMFGSPIGFMPMGFFNSLKINFESRHAFIFWLAEKQGMKINSPLDIIQVYYSGLKNYDSIFGIYSSGANGTEAYIKVLTSLIKYEDFYNRSVEIMHLAAEWQNFQTQSEIKVDISEFVNLLK